MLKILYICTHNRCRSILSEAISNHVGAGRILARSAGSHPADEVHPLTLKYLRAAGVPTAGLLSQSWDEMEGFAPDLVITVCDTAAEEVCPIYFHKSHRLHWGLRDPSRLAGTEQKLASAFSDVICTIRSRVDALLAVDADKLDRDELSRAVAGLAD
ncbi:MAG: arsenate reductase [Candidatus Azotimanducaceae bacterium]